MFIIYTLIYTEEEFEDAFLKFILDNKVKSDYFEYLRDLFTTNYQRRVQGMSLAELELRFKPLTHCAVSLLIARHSPNMPKVVIFLFSLPP